MNMYIFFSQNEDYISLIQIISRIDICEKNVVHFYTGLYNKTPVINLTEFSVKKIKHIEMIMIET